MTTNTRGDEALADEIREVADRIYMQNAIRAIQLRNIADSVARLEQAALRAAEPSGEPTKQCGTCEGQGHIVLGHHFVSREMASDAGEPSMEGMDMGPEYGNCPECNGTGVVMNASTQPSSDALAAWDAADWADARTKLKAIADYTEQLENFDDAMFLRNLAATLPPSGKGEK